MRARDLRSVATCKGQHLRARRLFETPSKETPKKMLCVHAPSHDDAQPSRKRPRSDARNDPPQPPPRCPGTPVNHAAEADELVRKLLADLWAQLGADRDPHAARLRAERAKLLGSIRLAQGQVTHLTRALCCGACHQRFESPHQRTAAAKGMQRKLDFLRQREAAVRARLAEDDARETLRDAVMRRQRSDLAQTLRYRPLLRLGYVNYFRSLREEGLRTGHCAVCARTLPNPQSFLANMDRFSLLAGNRFFDTPYPCESTHKKKP